MPPGSSWRKELLKMYSQSGMIDEKQCSYLSTLSNKEMTAALSQLSKKAILSEISKTRFPKLQKKRKERIMETSKNLNEPPKPYHSEYTAIREAVANGWIEPLSKDAWRSLTRDDALKIIEKVNAEHGHDDPTTIRPTAAQYHALADAVASGEIEEIPPEQWNSLNKKTAGDLIAEFRAKRPAEPATESQKKLVTQLVKEGYTYSMTPEKFHSLSKEKASQIIYAGMQNKTHGKQVEGFDPNYQPKGQQPMTPEQKVEIERLVAAKRLNPVKAERLTELTQSEAGRIIFVGQDREKQNQFAPEMEHDFTKRPPVPTRTATSPSTPAVKSKDKGMEH